MSQKYNRSCPDIEPALMKRLQEYSWPGNVRELQNVVERMLNLEDSDTLRIQHLPESIGLDQGNFKSPQNTADSVLDVSHVRQKWRKSIADQEISEIRDLLSRHGGNVSKVAKDMGISRNTLYRKMKKYQI
jgi:transcriptional regulator with PAS, ATPase and Fis domain